MIILNVRDLSFSYGANRILDGVSFSVDSQDRCGVVGVNGAGKSTLFALLNGDYEQDGGDIQFARGTTIGYFRQNNDRVDDESIGDAVRRVFSDVLAMEAEISALEDKLGRDQDGAALDRYDKLRLQFEMAGGYEYRSRIRGVLNGLDIGEGIDDRTPVSILSGGQKTRLALALMLIKPPAMLLLDEPTNHLDVRSLEWLETYLKNFKNSLMVISHDRYFLDAVTTRTLEIEYKRLAAYTGGYSAYVKQKDEDRAVQERQYENQQKEIARLEAVIEQFRRWNTERSHITAKSREKALNRMERVDRPAAMQKKINIRFDNTVSNSQDAMYIDGVTKAYAGRRLFEPFSATVRRNDRIMVMGPNGCGKSTLLRMLAGQLAPERGGAVEAGQRIEMNYFDQEQIDLDEESTVFLEVFDEKAGKTAAQIRGLLGAFLFSGDDIFKKISMLSGGERARVALVKLVLSRANMLLLDEPTNHLDINTREKLEEALLDFKGVVLAVSHDRYLIRKIATRIFYFEGGRIYDFAGGYDDMLRYLAQRGTFASGDAAGGAAASAASAASAAGPAASATATKATKAAKAVNAAGSALTAKSASAAGPAASAATAQSSAKQNWLAARENRSRQKKSETRIAKLESEIDSIEKRLADISSLMKTDDVASDHVRLIELASEQGDLNARLEALLAEWEALSSDIVL
ncbi:MAG: ABC-F family ATP-binding cassette domain-containing protein [Oscillospiraceae bacterium]|nr:ABC-F family ATP-binding cassette domain-containing protein [Oscillospiraceae bacterium]